MLSLHLVFVLLATILTLVAANDIFELSAQDAKGNIVPLSKYKDAKVIIIGKSFFY